MKQEKITKAAALITAKMPDGKSVFMALVMTVLVVGKAWAGDIAPRAETVVTADVITVGDIFHGITRHADHVLAPAPMLGGELVLSAHDLTRISDAFGFGWKAQSPMDKTVVRRDAQEIDRFQIEAALQEKLALALPGQKFETAFDSRTGAFYIPPHEIAAVSVEDLRYDLARGAFRATLVAGDVRRDIAGQLHLLTSVPVLAQAKRSGDIIMPSDITYLDIRSADLSAQMIVDEKQLLGLSPRRSLPAMRPIVSGDIVQPMLVKKGEMVTVSLQNGSMSLTTQARALENGGAGSLIRVMNMSSRQVLDAVVTGAQNVSVRAAGS
ncbi:MAG: flagellar basal body P-ring formation chaperone FlgA [Alphaproteobacteria bacterium]|jgi:flagella basal body P-ring formation protein FlgA